MRNRLPPCSILRKDLTFCKTMMTCSCIAHNLILIVILRSWDATIAIVMRSFLDTAIQVFDFFISTEESLRHELPLTLLSLSLAIISLKILSLRAKYEHFRVQSGLLVTRSIIITDLKLLISNAWKLEVFWYLAVFYSSLNLLFKLPQFFFHTRVNISTFIV